MGEMGMDMAVGTKNATGGIFLNRIVNKTIGMGRGRVLGPVGIVVSALYTNFEEREMLNESTYQD